MRSIFVSQLSARVTDRELVQFFEQHAGPVREARVITDRISRRSKGYVLPPSSESSDRRFDMWVTMLQRRLRRVQRRRCGAQGDCADGHKAAWLAGQCSVY